jgi:tripeptidyl-peptidase-1
MVKSITFLLLLATAVHAGFSVVEKRNSPPPGFSRIGPTSPDKVLSFRLALTQANIAGLQDTVYELSTPGNSRYGQYLTKEEVRHISPPYS